MSPPPTEDTVLDLDATERTGPDSAETDTVPTVDRVLVPVDGTDESTDAVEYAVAIADKYDAELYVVYVLDEDVVRAIERGSVDEDEVATDNRAYLERMAGIATEADVAVDTVIAYGYSTRRKRRHPGSAVLDCADEIDADFIVVPRESPTDDEPNVLEKAAEYTLLYASQPVLSV